MAHSMNQSSSFLSATTKIILYALKKNGVTATAKQRTANMKFKCAQ